MRRTAWARVAMFAVCFWQLSTSAVIGAVPANETPSSQAAGVGNVDPLDAAAEEGDRIWAQSQTRDSNPPRSAWDEDYWRRSWEWHLFSSQVIFWLVVAVVLFGMFISWLQFKHDLQGRKDGERIDEGGYDVSASLQSVNIKSKTIGAVILVASSAFFIMYLVYVYPMREMEGPSIPAAQGNSAS
jgi:hypothetical protein